MKLDSGDLFKAARNARRTGTLELIPAMKGRIAPGGRFFESFQSYLLEEFDLEKLDNALFHLAPTIHFMADTAHWEPSDFTGEDMFRAVRNLQRMGVFDVVKTKTKLPGGGDRYFEHYQKILVEKIGLETLDSLLHTLGQCIKFLASEEALKNVKISDERSNCA